jgi:hypothetical protein
MKAKGIPSEVIYEMTGLSEKDFVLKDSGKPAWKTKKKFAVK